MKVPVVVVRINARLILGLAILAIGAILLLESFGLAAVDNFWDYWPLFLVAVGLVKLNDARRTRAWISASLWILVGAWWTLYNLEFVDLHPIDLWPILLILGGLSVVRRAWRPRRQGSESSDTKERSTSCFACFSGIERTISTKSFTGAEFNAVMGGCEVDLTQADIDGTEATIEVNAVMGGIDIRVPRTWTIEPRVTAILGGFSDRTDSSQADPEKRLIIRGTVLMGGVDIKN